MKNILDKSFVFKGFKKNLVLQFSYRMIMMQ